ncbi:prolipoprotein diacylglyceryl transferase [Paludisphaera soli]|uniref:prolipoprotein diacylglyceryl transferase n=1 Tax=Paludisphaera soli TaxID=2712865 RepID=UPI0013ED0392|nr:prolipoprotein diacylglyceryl transferase [Paludisphaera soli]
MQPILFELLGFKVHAYGLMMALACSSALGISVWRARREGMDADVVYELATWLFLGGVVGARALYVLVWPESLRSPLDLFRVWEGGGVFYGCILGGLGGTLLYHRRKPFPFLKMADVVAPALAVGAFFGRIGCHLNGCCHGAVTESAWGVRFPAGSHAWAEHVDLGLIPPEAAWSLPVHPTQLLAAFAGLALLVALTAYFPFRRRPGQVMALLMIAYPISRWPVEMLRGDDPGLVAGLTISQLISLALCAAGAALWLRLRSEEGGPTLAAAAREARVVPT